MPEDCIAAFEYMEKLDDVSRAKIDDLYGETSYLVIPGKLGTDGDVVQTVEYKEVAEDLSPSHDIISISGADFHLF